VYKERLTWLDLLTITISRYFKALNFSKHQRNLIPLWNSSKINKAFHGLAFASPALVTVRHVVASKPIFHWGVVTTWSLANKESESLFCNRATWLLQIDKITVCQLLSQHIKYIQLLLSSTWLRIVEYT